MNFKTLRITLQIIGSIVAVAWFIEYTFLEMGFDSNYYLAPFAFGPLIIATFLMVNEKKRAKTESDKIPPHQDGQPRK